MTVQDLAALPQHVADVTFQTSKGKEGGLFGGVLLWDLLKARGIETLKGHNAILQHAFVVTGRDGYSVIYSLGEIAPEFGGRPMLLATSVDGKPMKPEDSPRLVVPGDARGGRNVKAVDTIDVR